ncbi:MAG: nickel pincer cofactor biosynthesis protein LarC [Myxococcota bacterium]
MSRRSSTGSSSRTRAGGGTSSRGNAAGRSARASKRKSSSGGSSASSGGSVLHLDTFSGIAGNMFLGALLDLGLSRSALVEDLAGLGVAHKLVVKKVQRGALAAKYVDVRVPGARSGRDTHQAPRKPAKARAAAHDDHHHHHGHHAHSHGRSYREIVKLLEGARLDADVRARAIAIFTALGEAEARVHGLPLERVHFHEVGAVDAIVDVTGAAIGLARLGIERVSATPVALGEGTVETDHGRLPLPAPATLELLRGVPTVPAHTEWETVTPTGAAILRTIVDEYGPLPAMTVEAIGYGAGNDRSHGMPNVLRAVMGSAQGTERDRVVCLETNLDDLVPEHFAFLMERLFEAGALDVALQPLQMKKNRPGILVRVLGRPSDRVALARILFAESTALGVRVSEVDRIVLRRESRRVDTPYGRIGVKVVWDPDGRESVSAEIDDCIRAARKHDVPLREVVRVVEEAARG